MQKAVGKLEEAVSSMRQDQRAMADKLDVVAQKVHTAQTIAWVVGIGIMTVVSLVGWLISQAIAMLPTLMPSAK